MGEAERVYLWGAILFGALAWLLAVSRRGGLAGLLSVGGMAAVCAGCDLYLVGLTALGLWLGAVGVVVSLWTQYCNADKMRLRHIVNINTTAV